MARLEQSPPESLIKHNPRGMRGVEGEDECIGKTSSMELSLCVSGQANPHFGEECCCFCTIMCQGPIREGSLCPDEQLLTVGRVIADRPVSGVTAAGRDVLMSARWATRVSSGPGRLLGWSGSWCL